MSKSKQSITEDLDVHSYVPLIHKTRTIKMSNEQSTSKPIFVVRFPYSSDTREHLDRIAKDLIDKLPDYHVLPLIENHINKIEFECYNAINSTDKDIEDIKQMVLKQFENDQQ